MYKNFKMYHVFMDTLFMIKLQSATLLLPINLVKISPRKCLSTKSYELTVSHVAITHFVPSFPASLDLSVCHKPRHHQTLYSKCYILREPKVVIRGTSYGES